jgi:glycosyltransferase involved in cell wall biosynthesis
VKRSTIMARMLFVSTMSVFPWGGSEELWSRAAEYLTRKYSVACSVCRWPTEHRRIVELRRTGVSVYGRLARTGGSRLGRRFLPSRLWRNKCEFTETIEEYRPDLVVISQGGTGDGATAMAACRALGAPYLVVVQAVPEGAHWLDDAEVEALLPLYQGAMQVCFVSVRNREFLERQLGESLTKATTVRNPCVVPHKYRPKWPAGRISLACVARLEFYAKGQDLLVAIMSDARWRRRDVSIRFYGSGPNQAALERLIENEGLENLSVCGHTSDIAGVWEQNHALVLPSRQEGLPLALVEAFACGRSAIASPVGGNGELIVDGENGFLASSPSVTGMAAALDRMWERRDELEQLGLAAWRRAHDFLKVDPIEEFAQLVDDCCQRC